MREKWQLQAGRNIVTPSGTFYLTYGADKNGHPNFPDFVKLDRIAHQVAALPELIEALDQIVNAERGFSEWSDDLALMRLLKRAKGEVHD